jgi:hypothetical protein
MSQVSKFLKTAIELAYQHIYSSIKIYHGLISSMPFPQERYQGFYYYALLHLLKEPKRKKLIATNFVMMAIWCS